MADPRITDEAAEALAIALRNNGWQKTSHTLGWANSLPTTRERHTREAESLLEAALPHLAPQPAVDREALEKALRSVLAREGVDEFHDLQPLGWKLADAVIDLLNGGGDRG